jgi:hypothetical protein
MPLDFFFLVAFLGIQNVLDVVCFSNKQKTPFT